MIKQVQIQNFQSHKNSIITFNKGFNVIRGSTDSGKSSILRALKWGLFNLPSGKAFVSHWGGDTIVSVELDDHVITRKKEKVDTYILDDLTPFKSFGTKVPEEIIQARNMNEINFQDQIDSYFLLNESSGYVASFFNKLANLEKIDESQSSIKKESNTVKNTIIYKKETFDTKQTELESFSFLDKLGADIIFLETLEMQASEISIRHEKLQSIYKEIKEIKNELNDEDFYLELDKKITEIDFVEKEINKKEKQYQQLRKVTKQIKKSQKETKIETDLEKVLKEIENILKIEKAIKEKESVLKTLNTLTIEITNEGKKLLKLEEKQAIKQSQWNKEMKKYVYCPLCDSKIENK